MTFKKQWKSIFLMIFNIILIAGAIIFLIYTNRSKSHLLVVKNHFPWKKIEQKIVYDPLYFTSLSAVLEAGDIIQSVNGVEITSSSSLRKIFSDNLHNPLFIVVSRNTQKFQYEIEPVYLLFKPELFSLFLPLVVVALWFTFFNKRNTLLTILFYFQVVMAVTFCQNSYLYTGQFVSFTLGSAFPVYFYFITFQALKKNRPLFLLKLILAISYALLTAIQIAGYIAGPHFDLIKGASIILTLLNQGGYLCFLFYLAKKLRQKKRQNGSHMIEWQFSGFLLFYIPYIFFEVIPLLLQAINLNLDTIASGSYTFLFFSCFLFFSILAKVLYRPVFLYPLEDKWLYFLFNLLLFLMIPILYSKLQLQSKKVLVPQETGLFLVLGSIIIFALFFALKKLIPLLLIRFFPNQRIDLTRPHLHMYRKTQEEYYWKHRFHELEQKLFSDQSSLGISHVHQFFMSYKSRVAQFLNINEVSSSRDVTEKTQWNQLLSLNQFLQNLCDRTVPVIDSPAEIEFNSFLQTIIAEFSDHPLFSSLVLKKTGELIVVINQEEIKFILQELIKNAFEALDSVENNIELSVKRELKYLVVSVIDSGTGIFPNQRDKLFSPFYTTKSNHLGMGLYISRLYAVKNRGLLRYSKADNLGGSCFQLFLPEKIY